MLPSPPNTPMQPDAFLSSEADTRRPLIHHINADNSWLLQIPRHGPRPYFNILMDVWLQGPQIEFSKIFHSQSHTEASTFQTVKEIEDFVRQIENHALNLRGEIAGERPAGYIDAATCTIKGTDHCNEQTLRQLHPSVPVFTRSDAAKLVNSWKHFETVVTVREFEGNWRETHAAPLPDWIGIGLLTQESSDIQGIHKGVIISFDIGAGCEAVVQLPHGIPADHLGFIASAEPRVRVLALIHGLLNVKVGFALTGYMDANLGGHNGLQLQRLLNADYWIGTHDEDKDAHGLTSWLLSFNRITLQQALEQEREQLRKEGKGSAKQEPPKFYSLTNGSSMVLV